MSVDGLWREFWAAEPIILFRRGTRFYGWILWETSAFGLERKSFWDDNDYQLVPCGNMACFDRKCLPSCLSFLFCLFWIVVFDKPSHEKSGIPRHFPSPNKHSLRIIPYRLHEFTFLNARTELLQLIAQTTQVQINIGSIILHREQLYMIYFKIIHLP